MKLLIDIGNTRLKWAICNNLDIHSQTPILNTTINQTLLIQLWQPCDKPSLIAISCVGPGHLYDLVTSIANELWPMVTINRAISTAHAFGVTNAYQQPEKLGVDRWLGLVAGFHEHQKSLCVVGCGTAITVDVIAATGQHLGGLICPGLRLMKQALANQTENLDLPEIVCASGLANFTEAAIHNGALTAACGLIEQSLKTHPAIERLILTGGDAKIIADQLSSPAIIDPDLVLRGLALTLLESS